MLSRGCRHLAALLVAGAASGLWAQDPWDATLKWSGTLASGLADAGISQDKGYGLAMGGSYPLFHARGSVAFEFGYRAFPTTSLTTAATKLEYSADGYFGTAMYQFRLWPSGVYLQGGIRISEMKTTQVTTIFGATGEANRVIKEKGPSVKTIKPLVGAGYRMNGRISLEGNLFGLDMKNLEGRTKSGIAVEVVLAVHL